MSNQRAPSFMDGHWRKVLAIIVGLYPFAILGNATVEWWLPATNRTTPIDEFLDGLELFPTGTLPEALWATLIILAVIAALYAVSVVALTLQLVTTLLKRWRGQQDTQ